MKKKRVLLGSLFLLWQLYILTPLIFFKAPIRGELKILDRHQQLISQLSFPDGYFIPLQADEPLPDFVSEAFFTIEDERFPFHWGIDFFAKLRALITNLKANQVLSGASTITEQLIKNRVFPHSKRTLIQKLREANLALYYSIFKSKDEVFRSYLNSIYFGNRIYGLKAAMKLYFNKSHLETLSESELITLLAILRSPGVLNSSEKHFQLRYQQIKRRLREGKKLSLQGSETITLPSFSSFHAFTSLDQLPHVTSSIKAQLRELHKGQLASSDSSVLVQSTIDLSLQKRTQDIVNTSLTLLTDHQVSNAAVYVVQPSTGDILVWQGSRDFNSLDIDGQVNVITRPRQMGSALKPFLYHLAFQEGYHPDQLIVDLEKDFPTIQKEQLYRPLNYGLREGGIMPLKIALANSFNIASVRLLEILGINKVYRHFKEIGLPLQYGPEHYGYSLALGSPDLPMQSVADAYGWLANGEKPINSHLIRSVQFTTAAEKSSFLPLNEGVKTNNQQSTASSSLNSFPSSSSFHLWNTLSNPLNRRRSFGSNSVLNTSIPFASKTGTTKNFKDNWTFGYHPDLVVATWVGNNDSSSMLDIDGITGAGPIWNRVVELSIKKGYVKPFTPEVPEGLIEVKKCLNKACTLSEQIFSNPSEAWQSDFDAGIFCRKEFVDHQVDEKELSKIAKLFDFKEIILQNCKNSQPHNPPKGLIGNKKPNLPNPLSILSPSPKELFTINPDIPLELQQIKLKSNQDAEWTLDGVLVGYGKLFYIQPGMGIHILQLKKNQDIQDLSFEVKEWKK